MNPAIACGFCIKGVGDGDGEVWYPQGMIPFGLWWYA